MSSLPSHLMVVGCPHCGTQLQVPKEMGGRQGQCLRCQGVVDIPHASSLSRPLTSQARAPQPQYVPAELSAEPDEYALAPAAPTLPALDASNYVSRNRLPSSESASEGKYSGAFGVEKGGLDAGILGGIGLMILAVVWFFGALLFFDVIFFYPPILFIIGLIAMVRGLFNNVSSGW